MLDFIAMGGKSAHVGGRGWWCPDDFLIKAVGWNSKHKYPYTSL